MNAIEFVKECGIDVAKRTLNNAIGFGCAEIELFAGKYVFRTDDLKQIVDAWELVESYSGLSMAKRQYSCFANACESVGVNQSPRVLALGRAISLVEQCQ